MRVYLKNKVSLISICLVILVLQIISYSSLKPLLYQDIISDSITWVFNLVTFNFVSPVVKVKIVNWIIHIIYCLINFLFTIIIVKIYYRDINKLKVSLVIYLFLVVIYISLEFLGMLNIDINTISDDISYLISSPLISICIIPILHLYKSEKINRNVIK